MKEYIEREALMNAFRSHMAEKFDKKRCVSEENCLTCDKRCMWHRVVTKAPAADVVERKRGEWLSAYEYALKLGVTDKEKLEEAKKDKWWKFCKDCEQQVKGFHNFCPNCGADMRSHHDSLCDQTEEEKQHD